MPERVPLWRRVMRKLRAQVERSLHPGRKRRAHGRLSRMALPRSVLFICEGNIYRSPFAAHAFSATIPPGFDPPIRVGSAGFVGPDRPSPADAQAAAQRRGIDLSKHRSTLVNGAMLHEWDLLVVMEGSHASRLDKFGLERDRILMLGDLDPETIDRRAIADPWRSPETVLEPSYARVERCVRVLADALLSNSTAGTGSGSS
jgi:protein-tyrosine phosphatase